MKVKCSQLNAEFLSSKTGPRREIERFLLFVLYTGARKANPRVSGRFLFTGSSFPSLYGSFQK